VFWLWLAVAGGRQLIGLDVTPLKPVEKSVSASVLYLEWAHDTRTAFVRKTNHQKVCYELTMCGERQETTSKLTLPPYGVFHAAKVLQSRLFYISTLSNRCD
jgi:hypothetical protein